VSARTAPLRGRPEPPQFLPGGSGAAVPRSARASGVPIAFSRSSTSVSTRETKNDATDAIRDRS
jgi:hypothetical protein